jgi:hypothetical protein
VGGVGCSVGQILNQEGEDATQRDEISTQETAHDGRQEHGSKDTMERNGIPLLSHHLQTPASVLGLLTTLRGRQGIDRRN